MNCSAFADKPFGVLSQGERQQTLVARARMISPLLIACVIAFARIYRERYRPPGA